MPIVRLPFLYPRWFRLGESAAFSQAAIRTRRRRTVSRPFAATQIRCRQVARGYATATSPKQSTFPAARHGKAVEPMPLGNDAANAQSRPPPPPPPKSATPKKPSQNGKTAAAHNGKNGKAAAAAKSAPPPSSPDASSTPSPTTPPVIELGAPTPQQDPSSSPPAGEKKRPPTGPMDAILHMGPPDEPSQAKQEGGLAANGNGKKMSPAPYVHHFDTYSLVKRLEEGGYSQDQSITVMKAVRTLLAQNLDVAQAGLISKRDMDNETYLFRAACSELSTEVKNNRRIADEQLRQQRTHVQHEVDIATQTLNQELLTLNDNVKGMFNDRRMAVREEQKVNESAIQQINYKISVTLTSDAKSSIEGMRWILIRRGILGLLVMAMLTVGTIRYASYLREEKKKRAKKQAREEEEMRRNDGRADRSQAPNAAEILAAN